MAKLPPTKGNLIAVKRSHALAKNGYELMDRKRNILIREMMSQIDRAKALQQSIDEVFSEAYEAIARANISMGGSGDVADSMAIDGSVQLRYRSVMGVELPTVSYTKTDVSLLPYGFWETTSALDLAYHKFVRVKELTLELAELENCIYRLAYAIKKSQKRANALHNIVLPNLEADIARISEELEEKDREEFVRQKVIKAKK